MYRRHLVHAAIAALLLAACGGSTPTKTRAGGPPGGGDRGGGTARVGDPTPPRLKLPAGFKPTRNRVHLAIDPAKPDFHGSIEIDGELSTPTSVIWLNAEELRFGHAVARVGDEKLPLEPIPSGNYVALRAPHQLDKGLVTLAIEFDGRFSTTDTFGVFVQEEEGARYVFSQFEADGARQAFPCVDEPWSKVPWQLTLDVPKGLVAVANTLVAREDALDDGTRRVVFAETKPLPSYLVAFGVGPFDVVDAGKTSGGAPIRIIALKGRAKDAAWSAEVTPKIIGILEEYFGTPYPYEKADALAIPATVGFGAMENAGLITYRESLVLIDPKDKSENARRRYVEVAGHELAHQWFGDLVTPAWWDDLWLNESFATWMEEKVMAKFSPAWQRRVPVVVERDEALDADGLVTARRVHQPIESVDDISTAFDSITYAKGASVIRMIEQWVGPEKFRDGVRKYIADHAWKIGSTADFVAAIDATSDLDVTPVFESFIDQGGAPRLTAELRCPAKANRKDKQPPVVALSQERWLPRGGNPPAGKARQWQIPVCVAYGTAKTRQTACTLLREEHAELALEGACPTWFLPNAGARGYYRTSMSRDALDAVMKHGWAQLPPPERILIAGDVDAAVDRGELPVGVSLDLVRLLVRDGSRFAIEEAETIVHTALDVADDAQRTKLHGWIREVFGARARKLGLLPNKGEGIEKEVVRKIVLGLVAEEAGDDSLRKRAVELAKKWRELPDSTQDRVLGTAAIASADVRAQLLEVVRHPGDARAQEHTYQGLGAIRDPELVKQILPVLLEPVVDLKHGQHLLFAYSEDPRTQPVVEAFVREHLEELMKRVPAQGATGGSAKVATVFTHACDAARRDEIEAYVRKHFEKLEGGTRTVAKAVEEMDLCIARRAAMRPELQQWLDARRR